MGNCGTMVIRNGRVLLPGGRLDACEVLIADRRIQRTGAGLGAEIELDAAGGYVLPGLIDLHTHGIRTSLAQVGTLSQYARIEASCGGTTVYPTLAGHPEEMAEQMVRHRRETDELRGVPQVGGFRLEWPYLSRAGGGSSTSLAPIRPETTQMLLDAGGGHIKIWDISPELPGAPELISRLSETGVVPSIAHTQATIDQARVAVDAGARLVTHMFDTFELPVVTDRGVYPPGLVDYLLVEDRVVCEIVGDGTHVPPLLVEEAFRCKSAERIAFVTDGNFGAGLPPGRYALPGDEGGQVVIGDPAGGVRLATRDMVLAGSALTPIDGFRNAVELFGKDLATASRVCSTTPARLMGLNKGGIAPGRDADLIVLDANLDILYTLVAGEVAYAR